MRLAFEFHLNPEREPAMRCLVVLMCSVVWCSSRAMPQFLNIRSDNDEYLLSDDDKYVHVDGDYEEVTLNCTTYATEVDYRQLSNGSLYLPKQDRILEQHAYFIQNSSAHFCQQTPTYSEEFARCGAHILIDPDEYKMLSNGSLFIAIYSRTYEPSDYLRVANGGVYICVPLDFQRNKTMSDDGRKFSEASDYVTFVGLLISIVSLLCHLIVFCLVPGVRNLPGYCLASLSLSLLLAYVCFLTAFLLDSESLCVGLGMSVYFFFLTSFFWMNAIAFDVWRSFRVVMRELRISSHRVPWIRFLAYSLYSWAVPAVLTAMVRLFDTTDILPEEFRPSFGHPFCWFGQRKALLVFFAVPLIVVMLLNVVFFTDVIYVINRATLKNTTAHDQLKKRFIMFTRLALIMGLTWIFGIAAGFADQPFLWYVFIVLNTLQGLFIFAVFMGSSKVRGLCFKEYYNNKGKRFSMSVRTVSAAL